MTDGYRKTFVDQLNTMTVHQNLDTKSVSEMKIDKPYDIMTQVWWTHDMGTQPKSTMMVI